MHSFRILLLMSTVNVYSRSSWLFRMCLFGTLLVCLCLLFTARKYSLLNYKSTVYRRFPLSATACKNWDFSVGQCSRIFSEHISFQRFFFLPKFLYSCCFCQLLHYSFYHSWVAINIYFFFRNAELEYCTNCPLFYTPHISTLHYTNILRSVLTSYCAYFYYMYIVFI